MPVSTLSISSDSTKDSLYSPDPIPSTSYHLTRSSRVTPSPQPLLGSAYSNSKFSNQGKWCKYNASRAGDHPLTLETNSNNSGRGVIFGERHHHRIQQLSITDPYVSVGCDSSRNPAGTRTNLPIRTRDVTHERNRKQTHGPQKGNKTNGGYMYHRVKKLDFFRDKIGNSWLYGRDLFKPSRYLDAIKLRTNTFDTRVALNRAKK